MNDEQKTEQNTKTNFSLRLAVETDLNFILNSFLKSYKNEEINKQINAQIYFKNKEKEIKELIDRSHIVVACNTTNPNQIFAYCIAEIQKEVTIIHYIYVKEVFRNMKIATALITALELKDKIVMFTHSTHKQRQIQKNSTKYSEFLFNPFLIK